MPNSCIACGDITIPESAKKYPGLTKCPHCGFLTTDMELTDEEAARLYGQAYFNGQEYSNYTRDKAIIQRNFLRRLRTLNRFLLDSHTRLLEIGCAYGFFLELANQRFPHTAGIDISQDAVDYASKYLNVDARAGNYLDQELATFDVCCMWDTIEHVKEPDRFISKISNEITKKGLLAITTADIGAVNAVVRGKKWRQIHPPTHLHYFCIASIRKLLERNGFEIIHISHPSNLIHIETALYITLVLRHHAESIYRRANTILSLFHLSDFCVPVNMWDTMFIIAQKQ